MKVKLLILVSILLIFVIGLGIYYFVSENRVSFSISKEYSALENTSQSVLIKTKDFNFNLSTKLSDQINVTEETKNYNTREKFEINQSGQSIEITKYSSDIYIALGLKELSHSSLLTYIKDNQEFLVGGELIQSGQVRLGENLAVYSITKNARDSKEYLLEVNVIEDDSIYVFELSADSDNFNSALDLFLASLASLGFESSKSEVSYILNNIVIDDEIRIDIQTEIDKFLKANQTNYPYLPTAEIYNAYIDLENGEVKSNTFPSDFKFNPGTSFLNFGYLMLLESGTYNFESILSDAPSTNSKVRNLNNMYSEDIVLYKAISNKLINPLLTIPKLDELNSQVDVKNMV